MLAGRTKNAKKAFGDIRRDYGLWYMKQNSCMYNIVVERYPKLDKEESYIFVGSHVCPEDIETMLNARRTADLWPIPGIFLNISISFESEFEYSIDYISFFANGTLFAQNVLPFK